MHSLVRHAPLMARSHEDVAMRVMRLHGGSLDSMRIGDAEDPGSPGPGEIRVRIQASSLNYHDLYVATGQRSVEDGLIPLSDAAGTVEAIGSDGVEFVPGDVVVSCFFPDWQDGNPTVDDFSRTPGDGIGGYACEAVVKPATWFTRAPIGYDCEEAATLTTAGLTAWRALVVDGGIGPGDSVLTLGTGGVSIFALQITKALGATVIVTSKSDEKLERARALGADHGVNYVTTPDWSRSVLDLTDGRGVDHVVELGGAGTLAHSSAACRVGGHIALIGLLAGLGGDVPALKLMRRQQRLQGLIVGSREHQKAFVGALDTLALRPVIDSVFPLAELADAFRHQIGGQHFGKIALTI